MKDRARRELSRPRTALVVLCGALFALALPIAGHSASGANSIPTSLQGLKLARLDSTLGVAIVRRADGRYTTWRVGDTTDDKACRLAKLYGERIEWQCAPSTKGAAQQRFWLAQGAESPEPVPRHAAEGASR